MKKDLYFVISMLFSSDLNASMKISMLLIISELILFRNCIFSDLMMQNK